MKKRLLAMLLCVAMVASLLTVGAAADDESEQITPASGTCGDNLTWELDESGTLTISGTGRMADYDQYFSDENTPPWATETDEWGVHFNKDITKVILEEGVTYIGSWAFDGCGYIEEVIFPSTLKSIGDGAFYNKPGLTELNLPSGLESVGSYAFFATWGIEEIVLPDGLKHIGEAAFGGGMELTKIIVPESVTEVGLGAFGGLETAGPIGSGCELEFGWTTSIPDNAFGGSGADNSQYSNFTSITLPDTITSIGDNAFSASQSLKYIKIPDSVKSIGDNAFWWSGIESIELPDGLESLGAGVFFTCEYLKTIETPDSLKRSEQSAFFGCNSLSSVTIPKSLTHIGPNAFLGCSNLTSIYFEGDAPVCTDSGETGSFPSDATLYYLDGTDGWIDSEYYDPDTGLWRGYRLSIKIGGIPPVVSTTPVITLDKSYIEEGETATLTWNPVDSAVEYVVNIRKVGSEDGIQTYKKTSECKCEFSGLTEGTYYISVYAKDEHGNGSDLSNIVSLTVTNDLTYVSHLTKNSLSKATIDTADSVNMALYNVMFAAEFRPTHSTFDNHEFTGSLVVNRNWPVQNIDYTEAHKTVISDANLGTITLGWKCAGCMAYAGFISHYVYGTYGTKKSLSSITEDNIRDFIRKYADPGEQIRYNRGLNSWHSIVFLGESDDGNGFYYISYGGGRSRYGDEDDRHDILVGYISYHDFAIDYSGRTDAGKLGVVWSQLYVFDTNNGSYYDGTARDSSVVRSKLNVDSMALTFKCPVNITISRNGETLNSEVPGSASFGSVSIEENRKIFSLDFFDDYEINIVGYDSGTMNITLEFYSDGAIIERRGFVNVPVSDVNSYELLQVEPCSDTILISKNGESASLEAWGAGSNTMAVAPNDMYLSRDNEENDVPIEESEPLKPATPSVTYKITISEPLHGQLNTSLTNASVGSSISVTVIPDEGYELAYIIVDGERIETLTFTMPDHAVTVSAVFRRISTGIPFTDVSTGDWFYDYVYYVYANGLMDGVSATEFNPNGTMTRAMVWAILARIDGETVTGADWAAEAREWAVAAGVSDGTDPDGYVTREQLVTMLYRYAGEPAASGSLSGWADAARVSDWAEGAMVWAVGEGVITGASATELNPAGSATRAECAAILMRYVEL